MRTWIVSRVNVGRIVSGMGAIGRGGRGAVCAVGRFCWVMGRSSVIGRVGSERGSSVTCAIK